MKKEKDLIKNEFFFFFDKNMHVSPDLRLLTHENCRNRDKTHLKMGIRPRSKGFFGDWNQKEKWNKQKKAWDLAAKNGDFEGSSS